MKILHTSDWHVGRRARSNSRAAEHQAVLDEIVQIARDHNVDLVIVAGDQFDKGAPSATDERLVYAALTDLAKIAPTVTIAGNHDNPNRLDAVSELLGAVNVHAVGNDIDADDGGQLLIPTANGDARIALLPWIPHRRAVTADVLIDDDPNRELHGSIYDHYMKGVVRDLCDGMNNTTVNLLVGHMTVLGSMPTGGEVKAHTTIEYHVDRTAFPSVLDYVALGHLHRFQYAQTSGPPVVYPGSPLSLDFAETDPRQVVLIDVEADSTPSIETVGLTQGWPMTTVSCTAETMMDKINGLPGDCWVRVALSGPVPAGIAEQARNVLDERLLAVHIDRERDPDDSTEPDGPLRSARPPAELFAEYAERQGFADDAVNAAFVELHDQITDNAREDTDAAA